MPPSPRTKKPAANVKASKMQNEISYDVQKWKRFIFNILTTERRGNISNEYRINFPILLYAFHTANVTLYAFAFFTPTETSPPKKQYSIIGYPEMKKGQP